LALMLALALYLPRGRAAGRIRYAELLGSFGRLTRTEPVLRQSCVIGASVFGAFSAFWTTLAFHLTGPPLDYGSQAVGLFGLAGMAGALAAPLAGRVADRRGPRLMIGVGLLCVLLAFVVLGLSGALLAGLIAGVLLLDFGVQAAHISNQTRIYGLPAEAHN